MAIKSSGQLSLSGDIHAALGGTGKVAMSDTDVRGLIGKGASTQIKMSDFYGASTALSKTITIDIVIGEYISYIGYFHPNTGNVLGVGDNATETLGSMAPNDKFSNASGTINDARIVSVMNLTNFVNNFAIDGQYNNSGWKSLKIGDGPEMLREDADYSYQPAPYNKTQWIWKTDFSVLPLPDPPPGQNWFVPEGVILRDGGPDENVSNYIGNQVTVEWKF